MLARILIIDDEKEFAASLAEYLESFQFQLSILTEPENWHTVLRGAVYDLILLDIRMPNMTGIDLLTAIRGANWNTPVIMISGQASVENIVRAMRFGAVNFYKKPIQLSELVSEIKHIVSSRRNGLQNMGASRFVTRSPEMQEVLRMAEKSARTAAPVMIVGESGTGKELIANSLHELSSRKTGPFIKLNCAAIPDNLLESELFGYEAGAFTDAKQRKMGKFESAHEGTLFFDELGELSSTVQAKLLRVIQDGRFERLGGNRQYFSDVRIISATNRDIQSDVENKCFREDLFYRLAVITLEIPPLRERKEDILPLADYFLHCHCQAYQRRIENIDDDVKHAFLGHRWIGNVRELKNIIERAVIFCEEDTIRLEHLPMQYRNFSESSAVSSLNAAYDSLSREIIIETLRKTAGKKQEAAKILNVHRKTLYNHIKRLGIQE
ncbi:MAG: hypothetical protein B0D92_05010 [Spirochaeta sp. LUC14_002_19_P3]|nr:MAG: hypothetical protein B0D92_05010 [Spirochaeta sp. LUC14_002_19_P3]